VGAAGCVWGVGRCPHGGWVDWDDDIDIMIPRADFERDLSGLRTDLRRRGLVLREVVPNDMYKVLYTIFFLLILLLVVLIMIKLLLGF
jgi:hypothetical protein